MDDNQHRDPDITIKEEMIENVLVECKTEGEFQDRMDGVCEDHLKNEFVVKEEYLDDFIVEHVKEEPMDGVQVDESQRSDLIDVKLGLGDYATNAMSDPENGRISDDGESSYDLRKMWFVCHACTFSTRTNYLVIQHMKRHVNGNPVATKDHILKHSREKPYSGNICDHRTIQKPMLKRHMLTHSGEKPVCDYSGKHRSNMKSHMLTHSGEKPYACDVCDYRANQKSSLKSHMLTHSGEKPYSCNVCDYSANQRSRLKCHMLTHLREKPYSCNVCDYRTSHKHNFKSHMRIHSGEKPYSCYICDYNATHRNSLKIHMLTHSREKLYSCDVCDYRSILRSNLKRHMLKHSGEKPYSCDTCDYSAKHRSSLKCHMWLHSGEKPYACDVCDYKTTNKSYLKSHMLTHAREKPYACDVCDHRTAQKKNLKNHMLTHSGDKLYSCNVSDNGTTTRDTLKKHLLSTHSGEKRYSCNFCDYWTKELHLLKMHNVLVHNFKLDQFAGKDSLDSDMTSIGGKLWCCHVCDFQAGGWRPLQEHHRLRHYNVIRYICNASRKSLETSANVIVLGRTDDKLAGFVSQSGDLEKAPPGAVVDAASSDVASETLQDMRNSTGPLSDHNYCLKNVA